MLHKSKKGQTTVFLCIILLSVVVLTGILVDGSRIINGEAQVKRAVAGASQSALADYSSRMKNEYGIFALSPMVEEGINDKVRAYIERNLAIESQDENETAGGKAYGFLKQLIADSEAGGARYIDLYDFKVEDVNVTPFFNLSENEVVINQILEYMKYRAPKQVIEGIWEKLAGVKDASVMGEAYKKKIGIDKLLGSMGKHQQKLKRNIDGTIGDGIQEDFYIGKFNLNGCRDAAIDSFIGRIEEYKRLEERLQEVKNGSGEPEEVKNAVNAVKSRMSRVKKQIRTAWLEVRENQTRAFLKPNSEAVENIEKIIEIGENAAKAIEEMESFLNTGFVGTETAGQEFKATAVEDLNKLKELILDGKKAEDLLEEVVQNQDALNTALEKMKKLEGLIGTPDKIDLSRDEIIELVNHGLSDYDSRLDYNYILPQKTVDMKDPRKGKAEEADDKLHEGVNTDKDILESGISIDELPSKKKIGSPDFDDNNSNTSESGYEYDVAENGENGYKGNLSELGEEINLMDEESDFSENAFGFLGSMGELLSLDLTSLRDNIYVNEYIMGVFKNQVPALKNGGDVKNDLDLRGYVKAERETYFDGEVEYILHGNTSEGINKIAVKAQILLIRFGMDTLHVYTDSKKKELADGVAAAVAGWWTGGAGIPVIANLIMCGWGMGEAVIDLNDLMEGKSVPFYKNKSDWRLDIGLPAEKGSGSDSRLSFCYYDYLRLFLLLESMEGKIGRIEDLLELNMQKTYNGFKMGKCNTYIRIEATVSMKYVFMTRAFMPKSKKTEEGRHKFKVIIYEGY